VNKRVSVVDVHTHLYPRVYLERLKRRREIPRLEGASGAERFVIFPEERTGGGRPIGPEYWDLDAKVAAMDGQGVDAAILSLGNPWLDPIPRRESVALARDLNQEFSTLDSRSGGRLAGLGVLPNGGVPAAVKEVEWIAAHPALRGVISSSRPCGLLPDVADLEPLWEVLERAGLVFFIHPHYAVGLGELGGYGHTLPVSLGFPFETTVALARMALAGVFDRHPRLQVLAAHGGGALPFLVARLDAGWRSPDRTELALGRPPSQALAQIYVDAVVYHPRSLRAAVDYLGADHVLFGTDHPFSISDAAANRAAIEESQRVDSARMILGNNARRLFGLDTRIATAACVQGTERGERTSDASGA
jgi:aminocarboxymuconate-semialdehyde decarboxylase